jgi:glycosyltransferase involved in cell wall biosynthesis
MLLINARFLTQNITGVQRFAIEISKHLKNLLGDNVRFVAPKNIIHKDLAEELGVKVIGNHTGHLWEQIDLPTYLKSMGSPLLINLANTAPLFYRNKVITVYDLAFLHHPEWFSKKFTFVYNFLIPKICSNSKHIFTDSNYVKYDISKSYKINKDKITTIYASYGNEFNNFNNRKENFILAVGSIDPRKNLTSLIKIFTELQNINLIIVGQKNKVFPTLNIDNLTSNIQFTGYVSDEKLVELYNKAKIFVYPSFFEGFGIPPLEAQACGCPVICSNTTSLPEVGENSVIYCDPYKVEDIKEKIELVLSNENLQNELRIKGFENIKRFSWEKSAKKIIKTIEGLK